MEHRDLVARFVAYADDFERTFVDDNWPRLDQYFTADAVYETLGEGGARFTGRSTLLTALRRAVTNFDRRCASRTLVTTQGPTQESCDVRRGWSCTFTCPGTPDLTIEGRERAVYRADCIELLQEELTPESRRRFSAWLVAYGSKLK